MHHATSVVVGIQDKQPSALRQAAREAIASGLRLVVIHSTGIAGLAPDVYGDGHLLADARRAGQRVLEDARSFLVELAPDLDVEYVLSYDGPLEALEHAAGEARVLVVGADDVPWFDRLFRTRIAGHLALHAPCPVMVVPELEFPTEAEPTLVVALDGDSAATGTLRYAFDEARARGGRLRVFHAMSPSAVTPEVEIDRADLAEILGGWRVEYPDVPVHAVLGFGDPEESLPRESATAELLIMGRPRGRGLLRFSRSIVPEVLRRVQCPVVVVSDDPAVD